jgi:ubiquinone/menaquinone biosynthesis C-methylase UbiE
LARGMRHDSSGGQDSIFSEAQAYERFMGRWSRRLAPLLVRFAGVHDGDTVLDVGSGTGALTAAVAKMAPSSHIVGIDPAASYVALVQSQHGSTRIHFEVGDAQQLRFDNAMFDRTLSLLVVNFVPDVRKALGEMKRVTKPKALSSPRCGTTARAWRCCARSGTRRWRWRRQAPQRTSATCRSAAAAISRSYGASTACRTSSKRD